jgi:hypothetical protein
MGIAGKAVRNKMPWARDWGFLFLWLVLVSGGRVFAQQGVGDTNAQIAALEAERSNAVVQVEKIVNQTVLAYRKQPGMNVAVYKGWFHEGAMKPNFSAVDIRTTQEKPYDQFQYVSSDQNPGLVFIGNQLEFNANTKYFYKNRAIPKKKLTEAEMVEINRLYRIIGRCGNDIARLQNPQGLAVGTESENNAETAGTGDGSKTVSPALAVSAENRSRLLYGGVGLLVVAVVLLVVRKRRS